MVVFQRSDAQRFLDDNTPPKGTWMRCVYMSGQRTAALRCPTCDRAFCLANHKIDEDGIVSPSVVCPHGCGFHVMMKLEGWL